MQIAMNMDVSKGDSRHSLVSLASSGSIRTSACNPWNKALPVSKQGELLLLLCYKIKENDSVFWYLLKAFHTYWSSYG